MNADWGPFNDWSLWVLIEDRSMTDHYECWLRTVQWLITMNADWGPFNDRSLWVLIEDRSMTDHYKCWLRTVQWLITMSADWGLFNDWSLWVLIEDCSMTSNYHFVWFLTMRIWNFAEIRGLLTTVSLTTMINHSIMKISSVPVDWVNVSVRDLLTVFVPYLMYFNIAFIFLSIVSCVQSSDIHIKLTICIVLPHSYCNIVFVLNAL